MAKTSRTRILMPATARKGETIEITAIVQHDMETGFRRTENGELIARDIIRDFQVLFNGKEILRAEFHPAQSANPMMSFNVLAVQSGVFEFNWRGDNGYSATNQSTLTVTQ